MDEPDAHETARRIRAAIAYAGLNLAQVEELSGVKADTIRNYTGGRTRASLEIRLAIGRACGVPDSFMREGFIPDGEFADTLRQVEERLSLLELWRQALELAETERSEAEGREDPPAQPEPPL
jgi:transcriptional regulator with XRE-family HTH domain